MELIQKIVHFYCRKDCLRNAEWEDDELKCKKCGRLIAFYYILDGKVHPCITDDFKRHSPEIEMEIYKNVCYSGKRLNQNDNILWDDLSDYIKNECEFLNLF